MGIRRHAISLFLAQLSSTALADMPAMNGIIPCNSTQYRDFLAELSGDIFRLAVNLCLDDLRKVALKRESPKAGGDSSFGFRPVAPSALPKGCGSGDLVRMRTALRSQIRYCEGLPAKQLRESKAFGCRSFTRQEWCLDTNRKMLGIAESARDFKELQERARREFDWVQSNGWSGSASKFQGKVQFTAYYGPPPIEASAVPTQEFRHPLYRRPPDLIELRDGDPRAKSSACKICRQAPDGGLSPYHTREEIDQGGALKGRGLEIAYVRDPIDAAFLMVEGSGSIHVRQPNGTRKLVRVNYGGKNGRTLNMLGRVLKCVGAPPEVYGSDTATRAYINARPQRKNILLSFDKSYVFFKDEDSPPKGADGFPVTALHSFATDRRLLPSGSVMMVHAKSPFGPSGSCAEATSLGISQDTGGAIRGPHVDWYLGEGKAQKKAADKFNEAGDLFVALPKGGGTAIPGCR